MHNCYVVDEGKIDAAAFRRDAQYRAFDSRSPGDTVIHFHAWDEKGDLCTPDRHHECYKQGVGRVGAL
jgi:hypothetical protein